MLGPEFLSVLRGDPAQPVVFRLGKVASTYTGGRPQLLFDGEDTPTIRTYPYLGSYAPAANDRVIVATVGNSGIVLGKIV